MQTNLPNNHKEVRFKALVMLLIILAMLSMGLSSCKAKQTKEYSNTLQKDSVYTSVNFIKRDTTIVVPGDSLKIRVPVYSLTETPISIRTTNGMTLSLQKIDDNILAECNTEDLKKIIQLQDMIIQEYKSKEFESNKKTEVPVRYIPKIVLCLAIIGGLALIFLGYLILKFRK